MASIYCFSHENCPIDIRNQIINLVKNEWPNSFKVNEPDWPLESSSLLPTSLVLTENDNVISHALISRTKTYISSRFYTAFGLGSMVTKQQFRRNGYGRILYQAVTEYMKNEKADIGIFTCDSELLTFYSCFGWNITNSSPLIGGSIEKPFSSKQINKITIIQLFSDNAKTEKDNILKKPIFIELGEGKLW
jgi:predicted acetyltransferase